MTFPVMITCALQVFSVTQGNPVTFTAKTFAVCPICKLSFLNGSYRNGIRRALWAKTSQVHYQFQLQ